MEEKKLLERIEQLEKELARQARYTDMEEIEMLQSRYMFYLENGKIAEIYDELFAHDDPDVRVEIMDSGAYVGQEHVKRVWYTMSGRVDKAGNPVEGTAAGMANTNTDKAFLFLMMITGTPLIVVDRDGKHAWGQWHLFGPHTNRVFDQDTCMKKDTAFWIAGKYDNEYVKENGEWKFKKLHPICWIRSPYDKGWLKCADCRRTPSPYLPWDEAPTIHSFNPDEGPNPEKWGPMPHEKIVY